MASASQSMVVRATPTAMRKVLLEFSSYPEFLPAVEEATVLRGPSSKGSEWTVAFRVSVIRTLAYTLRLWEAEPVQSDGATVIRWSLVEGRLFKANEGSWTLTPLTGPGGEAWTTATYQIEIDLNVFLPGPLLALLTSSSLPQTLAAFKQRAERASANS
jgi:ribosome-associated toxin RatA of RatAB toxin-antitoxin module